MSTIQMTRGDTRIVQVTINGLAATGLTGCILWLTVKRSSNDPDAAAICQKLPAAWTVTQLGNATTAGIAQTTITNADTAGSLPGNYGFDIQLKDSYGNIYTVDTGTFIINPDYTLATS